MNTSQTIPVGLYDFGPCCACGQKDPTVRNFVMLNKRLPHEVDHASAWGCFVCGLPFEGASAILCDACVETNAEVKYVVLGYVNDGKEQRFPYADLTEPFEHDLSKHPEGDLPSLQGQEYAIDHCPHCGQKLPEYPVHTVEVHNAWTIYGINPDGTESDQKLAELRRPQDWGHPRWHYTHYRLEFDEGGSRIINHAHCWTDLTRASHQYRELFASLIIQALMPGSPAELCGDEFLDEDDFWSEAWGPTPPLYAEDDEDAFYEGEPSWDWDDD